MNQFQRKRRHQKEKCPRTHSQSASGRAHRQQDNKHWEAKETAGHKKKSIRQLFKHSNQTTTQSHNHTITQWPIDTFASSFMSILLFPCMMTTIGCRSALCTSTTSVWTNTEWTRKTRQQTQQTQQTGNRKQETQFTSIVTSLNNKPQSFIIFIKHSSNIHHNHHKPQQ